MIINEKQYKISKRRIAECNEAIDRINNNPEKDSRTKILLTTSLEVFRDDIKKEIRAYEKLQREKTNLLKERLITKLPSLLTEYKIKAGLTQKEFAQKLGVKEQQLQRYEANSFESVTFRNLLKYFDRLGLQVKIKETRMARTNKRKPKKLQRARGQSPNHY